MDDRGCVAFLQWALPRAGLRWRGFRRVRRQVCRRIGRRIRELGLEDVDAYRARLEQDPTEWRLFDGLCHIPISRFYRDRAVFDHLAQAVLPRLARSAAARCGPLRCWSAGCASGEEPYTLALLWHFAVSPAAPPVSCEIVATDADRHLLGRARKAVYRASSLRELPEAWRESAFKAVGEGYALAPELRASVCFMEQDVRTEAPPGVFHLVLCRNMAFTYFSEAVQEDVARRIAGAMAEGGLLVVGGHEALPAGAAAAFEPLEWPCFFRRVPEGAARQASKLGWL